MPAITNSAPISRPENEFEFIWPIQSLVGEGFYLEPFEIAKHASAYFDATGNDIELYKYVSFGPYSTTEEFVEEIVYRIQGWSNGQLYAIMTTRKPKSHSATTSSSSAETQPRLAGIAGFIDANDRWKSVEIGPIVVVPGFQGVGLALAVVELMVQHCLREVAAGGWGLRRVVWHANVENKSSIRLAERAGFKKEGVQRWQMMFKDGIAKGKVGNGRPLPQSSDPGELGRDSMILSRCWDD